MRLGSKSIRVRGVLERLLASDTRYAGLLCFSADEAVWLAGHGLRDLVVAYPTLQDQAVRDVCRANRAYTEGRPGATAGSAGSDSGSVPTPTHLAPAGPITLMVDSTAQDHSVTELTAGSAFFVPFSLDWFADFSQTPAMMFALELARAPAPGYFTRTGGGYVASGAAGPDRLPRPVLPEGFSVFEMAK